MKIRKPLKWNVIYHAMNRNEITFFNIFDHNYFALYTIKALYTTTNKDDFANQIHKELRYYFWSKCEYEIIVSPWPPRDKPKEKIDVFTQVTNNWDAFIDYIWSKKDAIFLEERGLFYHES